MIIRYLNSNWRPIGPLDFVLRDLRPLRPVRRARLGSGPAIYTIFTILDHFGLFSTIFHHFGPFWAILGHFGPFRTILNDFRPFRPFLAMLTIFRDFDNFSPFFTIWNHFWPFWPFLTIFNIFLAFFFFNFEFSYLEFFSGRFDTSGSMVPRLVPEILSKCAFCDEAVAVVAVAVAGIGDSRSLMCARSYFGYS